MNERQLKETIQKQADTIKELEADFNDEFVKGQMKTAEITKLNNIIKYFQTKMKGNKQFEQLVKDLKGGIE